MGLDVRVLGAEEALGALDREQFDLVDEFAAAVPAPSGAALGVLVREDASLGLKDGRVGEVFGGDELDVALLAAEFGRDGGVDFWIEAPEGRGIERWEKGNARAN